MTRINGHATTPSKAKTKRGRKGKAPVRRWEIVAHGGRIGAFHAADEQAAQKEFEDIVPAQFRADCSWREVKR